jgi:hypothetical protein
LIVAKNRIWTSFVFRRTLDAGAKTRPRWAINGFPGTEYRGEAEAPTAQAREAEVQEKVKNDQKSNVTSLNRLQIPAQKCVFLLMKTSNLFSKAADEMSGWNKCRFRELTAFECGSILWIEMALRQPSKGLGVRQESDP